MRNVSETLLKARDLVKERGLYQNDFEGPNGEICTLGAIRVACGEGIVSIPSLYQNECVAAFNKAVGTLPVGSWDKSDSSGSRLCNWNNQEGRTLEEVLAAFETAAAYAKEHAVAA